MLGFSQMELGGDLAKSGQPNFCWAMSVQLYRHNLFYTLRAPNYLESDREIVVDSRATPARVPTIGDPDVIVGEGTHFFSVRNDGPKSSTQR